MTALFAIAIVLGVQIFRPGCVRLTVWASFEKADLLDQIASDYEKTRPSLDLRCVDVVVHRKASGEAEVALARGWQTSDGPRPDVWSPAATTWVALLDRQRAESRKPAIVPSATPSIMQSPLVIAMPEPMAKALGWPTKDIAWSDIFALAQDPRGWSAYGHPEWGRFKLGKTNPLISTSGLHILLATYRAAPAGDTEDPRVRAFLRGVEQSVVHYGDTVATFNKNLADADDRGEGLSYVSAIAMEEKQVWDYDQGNPDFRPAPTRLPPNVKLVAVYPREGTLVADHPYVVLGEDWVDEQKRLAASLFLAHLRSDAVQQRLLSNAFRGHRGEVGTPIRQATELDASKPSTVFPLPDPATLQRMQASWTEFRKRARVMMIIDVSSSMGERVAGSLSKLELARQAASAALDQFAPDDEVSLWTYAAPPYREVVSLGPIREQKALLRSEIERLGPQASAKALYATLTAAVTTLRQRFDRDRINAVLVLTDGRNDDPTNNDLNGLLRSLRGQPEDERIRVFTVGYGARADLDALERIARASRGASYEASDPRVIDRVLAAVVSNF
ncbi:MAG TPA: substrate-binding and VWA domain-containing protein [Candidatus Limnocylindria bacterium]|nr:substrate-binding and VWA domain-containing protein [Candidatus Limnocylindria bacterium]